MFVKITKASLSSYWYANRIGEIFEVDENRYEKDKGFPVKNDPLGSYIGKEDCIEGSKSLKLPAFMDKLDLDNLADIIWWIKGYIAGAEKNYNSCPFTEEHVESLRTARLNLKQFIEEKNDN